jgi:hypothetical protein
MKQKPQPKDMVLTQAQAVPPPREATTPDRKQQTKSEATKDVDPEVLRDLKRLAERVGGLERLKEMVEVLLRTPR